MSRALGLLLGTVADLVFADPRRGHPVAGFGRVAAALERRLHADSRAAGVAYVGLLVGGVVAGAGVSAAGARRAGTGRGSAVLEVLGTAAATWVVLGGTSLIREGVALGRSLEDGDLAAARDRIPHLCARDPERLDAAGMARAGVESLAENTSDAVVAPLFWGAVAGVPGLLGYRAVNTLDAMVGYRSPRYRNFGWAAARLDDLANLVPARLAALLTAAAAPLVGGRPVAALRAWHRDAGGHPSPNAGPVEAAAAGALGLTLGGPTEYAHGIERRPRLGAGRSPGPADLRRAARLSRAVGVLAALGAAGLAASRRSPRRPADGSRAPVSRTGRPPGDRDRGRRGRRAGRPCARGGRGAGGSRGG